MPHYNPVQRLKIAFGGFASLIGFVILFFIVLTITETVDIEELSQLGSLLDVMVIVGVLDVFAGFLLLRSK